jgi:pimeloyl-ACP methyl ester carboxylesterase
MPETGYLDVNGARLYYEVTGEGHPLVFVHAGIADCRMWDEQVAFFAPHYRVLRYDTRGYGKATTQDVEYSNRRDLLALLDHLGVEKAYVVGCSRGGQIAIDFTLEFPERVAALIPVCAGLGGFNADFLPEEQARFDEMERVEELGDYDTLAEMEAEYWVLGVSRTPDQVDPKLLRRVAEMNRISFTHRNEGGKPIVLDPPAAERLGSIRVPTLVIATDLDESGVRAAADALANGIHGAQKLVITDSAHVPNMEHPDEFNRAVLAFLQGVGG